MSRKRQLQSEEPTTTLSSKRLRGQNKDPTSGLIEHLSTAEQKKKVELAWKKARRQNGEKEINFKTEIDQIRKETHPILQAQIDKLKKDKERKFILLDEWKEKQFKLIEESVEASRRECDDEFEKNVKEIKDHLLDLANIDKKKLKDLENSRSRPNRKSQRVRTNLRSKNFSSDGNSFTSIIQQIKSMSTLSDKEIQNEIVIMSRLIKEYEQQQEK